MKKASYSSAKKRTKKVSTFSSKLFIPMMIITILQLGTFFAVLLFGGEFSYIRKYVYNTFIEKNSNRKSYVENMFNQRTETVYNSAVEINQRVEKILEEEDLTALDIRQDKELDKRIISDSSDILLSLVRQNQVNDVFMILNSGNLYNSEDKKKKCGIYIRDNDPYQNDYTNNEDLLMEMGYSGIASDLGIVLDFEWAAQLDITDRESGNYDFYYNTIDAAEAFTDTDLYEMGYWSGFSRISRSAMPSIKYTLPLMSADGTIYGVVGIGITEKLILDSLPDADSFNGMSCYILGVDLDNNGEYTEIMHTGPLFSRLVNKNTKLDRSNKIEGEIYNFNPQNDVSTVGNIQELNMYNSGSPFKQQKWAFIAIGDSNGIMAIYNELIVMFIISSVVSLALSITGSIILNRRMTAPVKNMIDTLNKSSEEADGLVGFESSNIREIDLLGNAILRLQNNVKENAHKLSKIIGMADAGIGVFTYSYDSGTVYVSSTLTHLLELEELPTDSDVMLSFDKFSAILSKIDQENIVCSNHIFSHSAETISATEKIDIEIFYRHPVTMDEQWYKFNLSRDKTDVVCLVQDVTKDIIEKKRIEFERDHDITTGLLNRRAYIKKLRELFSDPKRLKFTAIIMLDLDNLKYVNDTYGHDFGDDYIRTAASVFKSFMDYGGIVSRMSGDEFNVCLSGFSSKEEIRLIIDKIKDKLLTTYCILSDGTKYKLRASGGVAWYPDDADNYDMLIKYADFAMYTIKHSTKGSIAEFDMETYKQDSILMTGIEEMNRIIDEERICFAFQSIVSARTGEIYGYEMLMRPNSEILRTSLDFIRLAKTGAKLYEIERLTWVNGLSSFREQVKKGRIPENSRIFINSLSNCIVNSSDMRYIEREFAPMLKNVVLEVLESEKENERYTEEKQEMLRRWGAKMALDDFGSGYNSEYLLIRLEPDLIKLDRSIICGCDADPGRISIIKNLVQMAKSRNVLVLAEGVETYNELKTVINCGIDLIQGFYVNYPMIEPEPPRQSVAEEIRNLNKHKRVK